MFQRSRGTYSATRCERQLRMLVQIPGRKIVIDERARRACWRRIRRAASSRVLNSTAVCSLEARATLPATTPTRFPARSASERIPFVSSMDDQPEAAAGIGNAPGDLAGRSGAVRLTDHDVAAFLVHALPRTGRARAPVNFERSSQLRGNELGDGDVEALRRAVVRLAGARHARRGRRRRRGVCCRIGDLSRCDRPTAQCRIRSG